MIMAFEKYGNTVLLQPDSEFFFFFKYYYKTINKTWVTDFNCFLII